ncbi:MAG: hypothetical protein ACLFUI_06865 [Halanaerobiales bacterium]
MNISQFGDLSPGCSADNLISTSEDYPGAARLKVKTVEEIREDEEAKRMAGKADKGNK